MEYAKKMALVEPRLLEKLQQQQQQHYSKPSILDTALHKLDQDMQDILNRKDISSDEKLDQYNQTLHKYLMFTNKKEPMKIQILESKPNPNTLPENQESVVESQLESEIIETAPKLLQTKAKLLLKRLRNDPNISWNSRGELVYKGETIEKTNINDLVQDALRSRKHYVPKGWQTFASALRDSNVPQDLIGNQERWQWMMHDEPTTSIKKSRSAESLDKKPSSGFKWSTYK